MIPKVNGSSWMSVKLKYFESGSYLAQVFVFFTLRGMDSKAGILMFDNTESLERFSFTKINRKGFDVLFPADDFGFEGKCGHWRVYKLNWKNVKCAILINLT